MPYGETKVYFDGSHYIAIPHTTRPTKRRPKPLEEKIVVVDKVEEENGDKPFPEPSETEVETTQQWKKQWKKGRQRRLLLNRRRVK